ncbi:MAG TPA: cytochrome c1 [Eoetvoesiella sp.]|jgi:ubiquinol-cytochrome c reductase cytochrome c1 subunit|uniref:cytochrome c1 n=1 Tax=Eoetvoesiella sp. TaxID=1966355 RepID=UPI002D081CB2|nr:cytochrome c1 [Eoetvoesiella sp.]HWK59786.1 cytochrome c1 [Eoetvoesiella sp.]
MIMIKKLLGAFALALTCSAALASEGGVKLDAAPYRINNMASLQNGAKLFVNYCLSCHSANSMRYNRLTDIGLTEDEIKKNLLFTADKVGSLMTIAMRKEDSKKWFGATPPDLSVIARAKSTNFGPSGVDYIYTFLRSFYRDTNKKTGWDNAVFPSVAMPNVLWQLQGPRTYNHVTIAETEKPDGKTVWTRTSTDFDVNGFSQSKSEELQNYHGHAVNHSTFKPVDAAQTAEYDNNVADLSNFLGWMSEPAQLLRKKIGFWVLLFLGLFLVVAWRLNAAFWKDVK